MRDEVGTGPVLRLKLLNVGGARNLQVASSSHAMLATKINA